MPGSRTPATLPRTPLRFAGRLLLCTIIVLTALQALERPVVEPLIPAFRTLVPLMDGRFTITDARLSREGANETLRFRANLSYPLVIDGHVLSPFGSNGVPAGGFQVTYALGGVFEYDALLLIGVLAWPVRRARELAWRLALALPLLALAVLIDIPLTVVAELRNGIVSLVDLQTVDGWMTVSRFLMGGGGWVAALTMSASCIAAGRHLDQARLDAAHFQCFQL